jgi:hypothetical protein
MNYLAPKRARQQAK